MVTMFGPFSLPKSVSSSKLGNVTLSILFKPINTKTESKWTKVNNEMKWNCGKSTENHNNNTLLLTNARFGGGWFRHPIFGITICRPFRGIRLSNVIQ